MNIYQSTKVRPYVYMGTHKLTKKIYIGYREANTKPSHIDLFDYRTSSRIVNPDFDQYDWYIVAEFNAGNDAYDFEQQLIFEHWDNPLLLNGTCHYGKQRFKASKGVNKGATPWNKGKIIGPNSVEHCKNISAGKTGKSHSVVARANMSIAQQGHIVTDKTRNKISSSKHGIPKPKNVCRIFDKKEMNISHYVRWSKKNIV